MISPLDDYFHPRSDDPHWNESAWFGFHVPERNLTGWLYIYHRRNMNYTQAGVGLFDPSGEFTWDSLFHDWHHTMELPPDAEMFDFAAENSLVVRCVEPWKTFTFAYDAEGLVLDLTWTATMEPHDSGLPGGMADWALENASPTGHYEQSGRMTGTVRLEALGDEVVEINCWSVRDHSWGPRKITHHTPRGVNPWAANENMAFFLSAVGDRPSVTDPVDGTTEVIKSGFYRLGGDTAGLFDGTYRCTERGSDGRPLTVVCEATDTLGRSFTAVGRCTNWLIWPGYPHYFQWWSLAEFDVNGEKAWGNVMEWLPADLARRWLRTKSGLAVTAR